MKRISKQLALTLFLAFNFWANAQTEKTAPFHISFITPLSTNGMDSWNTTNNFSINLFAGYSGGLDGLELGGFANILKNDMKGAQFAGFSNVVLGHSTGAQMAGFANYTGQSFDKGAQFAGFSNVVNASSEVIQGAGFSNTVNGKLQGVQMAGFANFARGVSGGQFAGYININTADLSGAQISGFGNVATGDVKGVQIAGFFNFAKNVKGTQIAGFFNYAETLEDGIAIGFLSYIKNGYHKVEVESNESFYAMTSYKTGTRKFYNILSLGGSLRNDVLIWGYGYGIGTTLPLSPKWDVQIEASSYHINEDEWHTDKLNLLNKLKLTASYQLSDYVSVYAGPSMNLLVSSRRDAEGNFARSAIVPWDIFDKEYDENRVIMYPGFTLGIRL